MPYCTKLLMIGRSSYITLLMSFSYVYIIFQYYVMKLQQNYNNNNELFYSTNICSHSQKHLGRVLQVFFYPGQPLSSYCAIHNAMVG